MRRVALIGASGYAGQELRRLIERHAGMELAAAMTARVGHTPAPPTLPHDPEVAPLDLGLLPQLDGVFLCTPHGTSADLARAALDSGCAVVDLSADFRLRDPDVYADTYGQQHPAPDLLAEAVYGLTEHEREHVANSRLVANPGCYPTSILLPVLPLLHAGLIAADTPIVADAKSGVSGAGKAPTDRNVFGAVDGNFSAYGVGNHRHAPEIWQQADTNRIQFVPHLLPLFRGILTTLYVQPAAATGAAEVRECLRDAYAAEPFVRVYDRGLPELNRVQNTNLCDIGAAQVQGSVVVVSVIDNLMKGAAGQALQNMNLMLGLDEGAGLT